MGKFKEIIGQVLFFQKQQCLYAVCTCIQSDCWGKIRRKSSGRLPSNGGFQFL